MVYRRFSGYKRRRSYGRKRGGYKSFQNRYVRKPRKTYSGTNRTYGRKRVKGAISAMSGRNMMRKECKWYDQPIGVQTGIGVVPDDGSVVGYSLNTYPELAIGPNGSMMNKIIGNKLRLIIRTTPEQSAATYGYGEQMFIRITVVYDIAPQTSLPSFANDITDQSASLVAPAQTRLLSVGPLRRDQGNRFQILKDKFYQFPVGDPSLPTAHQFKFNIKLNHLTQFTENRAVTITNPYGQVRVGAYSFYISMMRSAQWTTQTTGPAINYYLITGLSRYQFNDVLA